MSLLALLVACADPPVATVAAPAEATLGTAEAAGRSRRRMDIDQLQASIEQATGGIGWSEADGTEEVDLFEQLSLTLGKPDYLDSTTEDLTAGLLFQKFLDDAAKSSCERLVEAEVTRSAADRVLLTAVEPEDTRASNPEGVSASLTAALLRFHGRTVPVDDAALTPWLDLHSTVSSVTGEPTEAWRAVCIALITHPDFYSY